MFLQAQTELVYLSTLAAENETVTTKQDTWTERMLKELFC